MKNISRIFLFLLTAVIFSSCKTDFDVTAPYKEIMVVYGLLDQNEATHYLRINKAFLGDGNALQYSSVADSSRLGADISVTLSEIRNTNDTLLHVFDTTTIHDKDTGVFYAPSQLVFKNSDVFQDSTSSYLLEVVNKSSGNKVSSSTKLIHSFELKIPTRRQPFLDFKREISNTQKFEWNSAINGRSYQPILTFYYKEVRYQGDTVNRELQWVFPVLKSDKFWQINQREIMTCEYKNEQFYLLCTSQIPYKDLATEEAVRVRFADRFVLSFTIVGDEFSTYLDVNGPSEGLLVEKPSYSNIENGIGVFSSRSVIRRTIPVGAETQTTLQNFEVDMKFKTN